MALSNTEKSRRHADKIASIDEELDAAFEAIDWDRRNKASSSLLEFIRTYLVGSLFQTEPSTHFQEVISEMETALSQSRPWMVELPRGAGKSTVCEAASLYLLATGRRQMLVIAAHDQRAAQNMLRDIWLPIVERDSPFVQDFPEVCVPFLAANGSFRRRQMYRNIPTDIEKNASSIRFGRILRDGKELPTSGACIVTRGITSGIRGIKAKTRPDCCLIDDVQDQASSANPSQVQKLLDIINKDIMGLSGKGKLSVMMTATPICPDDLTAKIESNLNWKTTKYKALISWPKASKLWDEYFGLYDKELAEDKPHETSLQYYLDHRAEMDEGAELFQPERFRPEDGHVSGLQALLERRHLIGAGPFAAEYQMSPQREHYAVEISPAQVLAKAVGGPKLVVPDGHVFCVATIDINASYAASCTIVSFATDTSSKILYRKIYKMSVDGKLPDAAYDAAIISKLDEIAKSLVALGIHLDGIVVDCGGRNWHAVNSWAKTGKRQYGVQCIGFAGRSSTNYNPYVKTRLVEARSMSVLCGDDREHVKAGAGYRYVLFDADKTKELVHKSLLAPTSAPGSMVIYDGDADEHKELAIQATNEKLRGVSTSGAKTVYHWATREPHDLLDCLSMAIAAADQASLTVSSASGGRGPGGSSPSKRQLMERLIRERRRVQIRCG